MTSTTDTALAACIPLATHPLDSLHPGEIDRFRAALDAAGLVSESTRFASVLLREPHKSAVLAFTPGDAVPREVTGLITDLAANTLTQVVVDLITGSVAADRLDPAVTGWGPSLNEDFPAADALVKSDEQWVDALARRGVTELDRVRTVPLSAGVYGYDDEVGVRVYRVLAFWQEYPTDSVWAHPIDGVVAHVDLTNGRVLRVVETDVMHVPRESGDYLDPAVRGPERTTLKPISITQPEGVSFELDGSVLRWQNWEVRIGFNGREGLTLHQLSFEDQGRKRPIMYRGSISEMVVPYGDPTPTHAWQNYFDVGEYQFGRLANSLELGCDCVGEISYLDAVVVDDLGAPTTIRNAICIHEEDAGILWKHTDDFSGTSETRRQRRLVISFFVTVGNYDYGFYWYLSLDGTIELESKATGIVFASGHPGGDYPYASELAPGLGAPFHQHLFSARLDMTVDGVANAVDEIEIQRVPTGPGNPWGNALGRSVTPLISEAEAQRLADNAVGRVWSVRSTETTNRMGHAPAYVLHPEGRPVLAAADDSSARSRAGFSAKHLWVTQYDRDEMWAAGTIVNQNPGGAGLPAYVQGDRPLIGEDLVLWHTFGLTHFPRLEDWPIMPVDTAGFVLKPDGFFDRNPTLDVPAVVGAAHCAPEHHAGHVGHGHEGHGHGGHGHGGDAGAHAAG
ncbi:MULTISPECIES: primary-amine oxidase [unclassified Rathayibacter]|uniref:primary-amine oxidase n=1 Tax=unclassified Rathayibacter TaxID=2609250 RepID=UPI0009ECB6DA|nr:MULTISPECIES: primary-amine oxidase [unclassified Rathayibacter]